MNPWRQMNSTSTYSSAILNIPGWCRCTHCHPAGAWCSCTRAPGSCCCHSSTCSAFSHPPPASGRESAVLQTPDQAPLSQAAPHKHLHLHHHPSKDAATASCWSSPPPSPPPPAPSPEQVPGSLSSMPHCPLICIFGFLVDTLSR